MSYQSIHTLHRARRTYAPVLSPLSLAVACALGASTLPALANPAGGQVVSGAVTIHSAPGVTTINQASSHGIINWQSFSIQAGERTQFIQPSANSATLNRVVGGNLSVIHGSLQANGQVFLINPNGVLVGPGGSVQTGSFVASTRDVSDAQFLQGGALDFLGSATTSVVNLGSIHASTGDVHLIAYQVDNQGSINAPNGTVGMASGTQVLLSQGGNERLLVKPQGIATGASVSNTGQIAATNVELKAVGGNPFALAINVGGSISAIELEQSGGRILLKATQGRVEVSGELTATQGSNGGEIQVTGSEVLLATTAHLQASGSDGGGTVLVGGDYQGRNPDVQNAQNTFVEAGARISVDAIEQGNGGRVIVWADEATNFFGSNSARGGADGGNGGFVEVSGKQALAYRGTTDLRAPNGEVGTLLLDPTDITITNSAATGSLAVAGNVSTLSGADIQNALNLGNLTISTASAGSGGGDITFAQLSSAGSPTERHTFITANRLEILAERDIVVNDRVLVTNFDPNEASKGELVMQAGRNLTVNNHGFGSAFDFVYLWSGNLTLVADANNSGNGTGRMSFDPGVNLFSDNLRLFVPSTDQLVRPASVTLTNSVPNIGKWLGDPGTASEGIYARRAATPVTTPVPVVQPIVILPQPPAQFGLVLEVNTPSLDERVAATGDELLINALKVLNAAKEQLANDPNNRIARRAAEAAEEEIRKRLPDFDPFHERRLADARRFNDQEINLALNNIKFLESFIIKFGRDQNTIDSINALKARIDARMTALEGIQLVAEYLPGDGIFGKAFRWQSNTLLLKQIDTELSPSELDNLNGLVDLFLSSAVGAIRQSAIIASQEAAPLIEQNDALRAEIRRLESGLPPVGSYSGAFTLNNPRDHINVLRGIIDNNNIRLSELANQDNFSATTLTAFLNRFTQLRRNINFGRYAGADGGVILIN